MHINNYIYLSFVFKKYDLYMCNTKIVYIISFFQKPRYDQNNKILHAKLLKLYLSLFYRSKQVEILKLILYELKRYIFS